MGKLVRATASNGDIRLFAAITTDIVEKARQIHDLSPTASAALGRLLTAGSIMGAMLKGEKDTLTLSMNGRGPAGNLVVVANSKGNVKGYISNPHVDLPLNDKGKLDVGGAIGKDGFLNVVKDMGLKDPYVGSVPIYTGEVGDDIAYYFTVSEQVPSAVALGVLVDTDISIKSAGGLVIQMMPGANELLADIITFRLQEIPPLSTLIAEGKTCEDILNLLFDDMDLKIHEEIDIAYECDCSRERVEKALIALGKEELERLKEEEEIMQVECHFCERRYQFTKDDIQNLINSIK
ncbi:Hsp33 family molecular chaperone HslO [Caloramator proteoclasticus]|uniref:33 kDa chaperonin n=1 Tax=Caloramator proteoclasticus DSM 10124 TaxID=1121262 RepID=A0A1M4XBZ7_9CLOT|nr:Hsp33 family molecular chaperone HslO [Caloramator proteoclasticus]SHE91069.1 molecular chaperone Hsp33 [Caloramator proteoclasticus DSM 10124]